MSFTKKWDYTEEKPRTGENITEQRRMQRKPEINVPLCEKYLLTIKEAAAYFGIGEKRLVSMTDEPLCDFMRNLDFNSKPIKNL